MSDWNDYSYTTESGMHFRVRPHKTEEFGTPEVTITAVNGQGGVYMPIDELDAFVMAHRQRLLKALQSGLKQYEKERGFTHCPNCGGEHIRKLTRGGYKCDGCNHHFGVDLGSPEGDRTACMVTCPNCGVGAQSNRATGHFGCRTCGHTFEIPCGEQI